MAARTTSSITFQPSGYVVQRIKPRVTQGASVRANRVAQAARALAPKRTGRLSRSIRVRARNDLGRFAKMDSRNQAIAAFEVAVQVPYATIVSGGSRPHIIRSTGPWPLRNRETGQIFGPVVRHPGTKPNDYLQRALRQGF